MARFEYDDEPLHFRPHIPGKTVVNTMCYLLTCALAALGAITLLLMLMGA